MNLANRITIFRITLVPVFVAALLYYSPPRDFLRLGAIAAFFLACLTDALDGYLARRRNQKTEFGSYIDPIADKLLLVSGFLSLSLMPHLPSAMHMPGWVTITVISRDVVILIGAILIFFTKGVLKPTPIFVGKLTTVTQMSALFAALLAAPEPLRLILNTAVVLLTTWSGVSYVKIGGQMMQGAK
jgi:cardiolipin synthase (CMP-forming)